jgi:hypothetical protein
MTKSSDQWADDYARAARRYAAELKAERCAKQERQRQLAALAAAAKHLRQR